MIYYYTMLLIIALCCL